MNMKMDVQELPAYTRLRTTLIVIDVYLLLSGLVDIAAGVAFSYEVQRYEDLDIGVEQLCTVWLVGVPLLLSGITGLYIVCRNSGTLTLLWVISSVVVNGVIFTYITVSKQMEPNVFGVNLNVYGKCSEELGQLCLCKLPEKSTLGVLYTSCENVRWRTTLYLVLVSVFTVGLAALIIAYMLALTFSFWLPRCARKNPEPPRMYSTYTSFYAAETSCNDVTATETILTTTTSRLPLLPVLTEANETNLRMQS